MPVLLPHVEVPDLGRCRECVWEDPARHGMSMRAQNLHADLIRYGMAMHLILCGQNGNSVGEACEPTRQDLCL